MRFPGFTAEASLFKTDEPYRLIGAWAGGRGGQAVIPQAEFCWTLPFVNFCVCCDFPFGGCYIKPRGVPTCPP